MHTYPRSHTPYQRRLAMFYVFNDVVQYAAKNHQLKYLEHGSGTFLPEVSRTLERLSAKEKAPFIRVLSIWAERHVYSVSFVEKLRTQWESHVPVQSQPHSDTSRSPLQGARKRLLQGDPKLVDMLEVGARLQMQSAQTDRFAREVQSVAPSGNNSFFPADVTSTQIASGDPLGPILASMSAELVDLTSFLVTVKASLLEAAHT